MTVAPLRLQTSELSLAYARSADFGPLWNLWRQPEVGHAMFEHRLLTRDAALARFEALQSGADEGLGVWLARSLHSRRMIGCVSLSRRAMTAGDTLVLCGAVELRIALRATHRRLGHGQQIAKALLAHAFSDRTRAFIVASCERRQRVASSLIGRLGFQPSADYAEDSGQRRNYILTRADFNKALQPEPASTSGG